MNITFTLKVHSFTKAAEVEKSLKSLHLNYESKVDDKPSLGAGRLRRVRVTKAEVLAVVACRDINPKWNDTEVAKSCNVSAATVGRIRMGTHTLQQNNGVL